jgi:hypothetical protein
VCILHSSAVVKAVFSVAHALLHRRPSILSAVDRGI